MSSSTHRQARPFRRARRKMFAIRGTVCVHCGHPGAGEADHIVPLDRWPDQPVHWTMLQPSHGGYYPCPICGRSCNQERGSRADYAPFRPALDW